MKATMKGKLTGVAIVVTALIVGAAIYYLQVYAFYESVTPNGETDVELTTIAGGEPEPILYDHFQAIDADSSPIRYRACFNTSQSLAMMTETYEMIDHPKPPRIAPGWFDCFDAGTIEKGLESGHALAFMGQRNIAYGVDRIVAVFDDGRGYVWHELNHCGEKNYAGTVVGPECPPREDAGDDKEAK